MRPPSPHPLSYLFRVPQGAWPGKEGSHRRKCRTVGIKFAGRWAPLMIANSICIHPHLNRDGREDMRQQLVLSPRIQTECFLRSWDALVVL